MKKLLIGLLALVVLLIVAVLVGPSFVDWNAYKEQLTSEVERQSGLNVRIDGDLSLAILPAPTLSAEGITLTSPDPDFSDSLAALEGLDVRVALWPLLQQQIQVESVSLIRPVILLEVLPDGRQSWDLAGPADVAAPAQEDNVPAAEEDTTAEAGGGLAGQVRLDSIRIVDGVVIYRDLRSGQEERIEALNAELAAESLQGPFAAEGDMRVRGMAAGFDLSVDRLREEGATGLSVVATLPDAPARAQFGGALVRHNGQFLLRGRADLSGDDLAGLAALLGQGEGLPPVLAAPFSIDSDVTFEPQRAQLAELTVKLGDTDLTGEASVALEPAVDARVTLAATKLDLDELLAGAASEEGAAPAASGEAGGGGTGSAPAAPPATVDATLLPTDITAQLDLAVENVVFKEQAVRDLAVKAKLSGGVLELTEASAQMPGGSQASLVGRLGESNGTPSFTGALDARSDSLRSLLSWLDIDVEQVPADRLRQMAVKTQISGTPQQVNLTGIDLTLDLSRITGGVAIALRERVGLGIGLAIDKLDLDAYLPEGAATAPDATAGAGTQGAAATDANESPAAAQAEADPLDAFDANLDLQVSNLTYQDVPARGLRLDATLQNGRLTVREARVADLAGSAGSFSGTLDSLAGDPSVDGLVELKISDPVRLAELAGIDGAALARLGPFDLNTNLRGSAQEMAFNGNLAALGGRFGAAGTVAPAAQPLSFDVKLDVDHPSLPGLLDALSPGIGLDPQFGPIKLSGQVAGTPLKVDVTNLAGNVGPAELSGTLSADLSAERPSLVIDLATGELPLAALGAPGAAGGGAAAPSGQRGRSQNGNAASPAASSANARWSRDPIDLEGLRAVDANVRLVSSALVADNLRINGAELAATLNNGLLDVQQFNGTFYDGALSVKGTADARPGTAGGLQVSLAVTTIETNVGRLVRELADSDRVSGNLSLNSSLTTQGGSEAALVSALNGTGTLEGVLTTNVKAEETAGAAVLNILGDKIREIRGVTNATTALFQAFAGAPAPVTGSFTVTNGVVRTDDTRVRGRNAVALTQAQINLPAWQIDSETGLYADSAPDEPYVTARLRGQLDEPNIAVGGTAFRPGQESGGGEGTAQPESGTPESLIQNLLGGGRQQQQQQPQQQEQQQQPQPEDVIRNLLRGLGN